MIAFLKTGPGMKIPEPSNPTALFTSGVGTFAVSSAVSHAASSWTDGMTMRKSAKADLNLDGCMLIEHRDR